MPDKRCRGLDFCVSAKARDESRNIPPVDRQEIGPGWSWKFGRGSLDYLCILFSPDSTKRIMRPGEELQKGREVSLLFFVSDEAAGAYRECRRGG